MRPSTLQVPDSGGVCSVRQHPCSHTQPGRQLPRGWVHTVHCMLCDMFSRLRQLLIWESCDPWNILPPTDSHLRVLNRSRCAWGGCAVLTSERLGSSTHVGSCKVASSGLTVFTTRCAALMQCCTGVLLNSVGVSLSLLDFYLFT